MVENPFDSIESAHRYVTLLRQQVEEVQDAISEDIEWALTERVGRRLDALRLVEYKLNQLKHHLGNGSRILNDLRALRRLLQEERQDRLAHVSAGTASR